MSFMRILRDVGCCGSHLVEKQGRTYCPTCGKDAQPRTKAQRAGFGVPLDYTVQPDKGESIVSGYHPGEVAEARRLFPTQDIQDDGTVRYHSAEHRRRCHAEEASVLSRERERNSAHYR